MLENEPTLNGLAATITKAAEAITAYLEASGLPTPSFAEDSPPGYPRVPEVVVPRLKLLNALFELQHLILGPFDDIFTTPLFGNHDGMILDILNQFDFFSAVPLGGSATYDEIAQRTTLPESIVRRILRHAFLGHMFAEAPPSSGRVVHTAKSALVVKTPVIRGWIAHNLEEVRPATSNVAKSLREHSAGHAVPSQDPLQSGFALADLDGIGRPVLHWDFLGTTPEGQQAGYRAARFSDAMETGAMTSVVATEDVIRLGFDWESLGDATVVDVGGSKGHDAIAQAKHFPQLRYVVQDLPEVQASFHLNVPEELKDRVTYQVHDFFQPQITSADVYFLKMILHDWSDSYAARILQGLLPKIKQGGKLVLCEVVVPPPDAPIPAFVKRMTSSADLQMLSLFNSLERSLEQWKTLLRGVDDGLEIRSIKEFPGSLWSVIVVEYKHEASII